METVSFELENCELRPNRFFDVTGYANFKKIDCESDSYYGNNIVTERWEEYELAEFVVDSLTYWGEKGDSEEGHRVPLRALDSKDYETIKEKIPHYTVP
jgi:hypothetical protein